LAAWEVAVGLLGVVVFGIVKELRSGVFWALSDKAGSSGMFSFQTFNLRKTQENTVKWTYPLYLFQLPDLQPAEGSRNTINWTYPLYFLYFYICPFI
jgi:hypothetical protein